MPRQNRQEHDESTQTRIEASDTWLTLCAMMKPKRREIAGDGAYMNFNHRIERCGAASAIKIWRNDLSLRREDVDQWSQ